MKVALRFDKSVQENAAAYFDKAKKAKKKLDGLSKAIVQMNEKIANAQKKISENKKTTVERKKERKWFEKFHWFESSNGFLVLSGKDAKSNEGLLKKYFEKTDKFFHADIAGAAHTIVKAQGKTFPETTLKEAAQFAAALCKAWQEKLAAIDVYSADFDQVTKQAPSGESIKTGAFMVYGKRDWYKKTPLLFSVGINDKGEIISGPPTAIKKQTSTFLEISPGNEKKSFITKKIKEIFEKKTGLKVSLDELNQMLPGGEMQIKVPKGHV